MKMKEAKCSLSQQMLSNTMLQHVSLLSSSIHLLEISSVQFSLAQSSLVELSSTGMINKSSCFPLRASPQVISRCLYVWSDIERLIGVDSARVPTFQSLILALGRQACFNRCNWNRQTRGRKRRRSVQCQNWSWNEPEKQLMRKAKLGIRLESSGSKRRRRRSGLAKM